MTLTSRLRHWTSPAWAVPRLRALYYVTLALLAVTLLAAHRLEHRAHQDARLLAVASHACQTQTAPRVIVVRVPPTPRAAIEAKTNMHRTPQPARKEK